MAPWMPDIGLLRALTDLCHDRTPVVLTPPDRRVVEWATRQGFRVTVVAGTCEIRRNVVVPPQSRMSS